MASERLEALRQAIARHAFVRSSAARPIALREGSPDLGTWIFDFRALMLQPHWLDEYAEIFWESYAHRYPFQVGGYETAGIPLVTAIVMKGVERGTPVNGFFIRKSRKRRGLMKQIEGTLTEDPIILVDDLVNSGSSFEKQLAVLTDAAGRVSDLFAILAFRKPETYGHLTKTGVRLTALFSLSDFGVSYDARPRMETVAPLDVVWRFSGGSPSHQFVVQKSTPCLDATRVYFGDDAGVFRALEQENGAISWEFAVRGHPPGKGIFSSPALKGGVVYFGAYDGSVYALRTRDGSVVWQNTDADWVGSSPSLQGDTLYIGLEFGLFRAHGGITALSLRDGSRIWSARHSSLTHASPLYVAAHDMVVIGSNDGVLYAYDARSGTERWRFATEGDIKTSPAFDERTDCILCASMDGTLYGIDARSGIVRAAFRTDAGIYSTPLVAGEHVYVSSLDKKLYALRAADLTKGWSFETRGRIFASPAIHAGSVWIGSNDGILYEIDPERGTLRSSRQFSERIVTRVAHNPANGLFFVTTNANEIYALRRPAH